MDDLKCKKGKAANKKNDFLTKVREKMKKKRKSKGKENLETLKTVPKSTEPNIPKDLGRLRIKGGKGMEGMFFKGLRSEYISRESLNEANEARKKEDLNKIIDIGRAFLERRGHPGRSVKRIAACSGSGKREKSPKCFQEVSSECGGNFKQCPLSPIRFSSNCDGCGRDSATGANNLSLEEELEKFAQKYEQTVEEKVLLRLPESGVLEDAVKFLRKMRIRRLDEVQNGARGCLMKEQPKDCFFGAEDSKESDTRNFSGLELFTENSESAMAEENFIHEIVSPERVLISDNCNDYGFMEKPLDRMLIMTDVELENYHHSSFTASFDTESLNLFHFQGKCFDTPPAKELNITTPSIQFYRRNMF